MFKKDIKGALDEFSKNELAKIFPSLNLKSSDKKEILVDNIANSELSDEEINNFKEKLSAKAKLEPESAPEPKPESKLVYIAVHAIEEDGKHYKPGRKYTGKRVERFLEGGQIRKG